ncbi:MAG: universal stress protein [Acidimicrobiales bacterium]
MTHIVVGVDGSETAGSALQWALREATLRQQSVVAVLAWGFLDQHHPIATEPFDPSYGEADAVAALDAFVVQAVGAAAPVERRVVCELPAQALLEVSADAALLVVGARGLGGFRGLLLGSVSQQTLHHATCPIAIVRSDGAARSEGLMERIVVGIDGSQTARRALRWAIKEARVRGASLEVVHSWHVPYVGGYPYAGAAFDPAPFEAAARQTLDVAVDGEDTSGLAEPAQRLLVMGSAAQAILESAKGADLVVMGSRGLGGFKGLLLGSATHQVAQHATCPVVIVPPET